MDKKVREEASMEEKKERERKISQGRHSKDYLVKSEIGSTKNPERSFHKILSNAKSPSIENEINTYSVSEQKIEIDMSLQISLGQNDNKKNRNITK